MFKTSSYLFLTTLPTSWSLLELIRRNNLEHWEAWLKSTFLLLLQFCCPISLPGLQISFKETRRFCIIFRSCFLLLFSRKVKLMWNHGWHLENDPPKRPVSENIKTVFSFFFFIPIFLKLEIHTNLKTLKIEKENGKLKIKTQKENSFLETIPNRP